MSNVEALKLYETIIDEVINDLRQDFEDLGIDELTLQDLRRIWCDKLSHTHVARFQWDDQVMPPPLPEQPMGGAGHQGGAPPTQAPMSYPQQMMPPLGGGLELPGDSYGYGGIELPNLGGDTDSLGLMLPRINQADGTIELTFDGEHNAMLRKWQKMAQAQEAKKAREAGEAAPTKRVGQADGQLDDEDDGLFNALDDINSDLDDGLELEKLDDEDGDLEGQIMLCLYDRVQRVKNKWKCNLKEGIANIDGKDYVFQKATGESEW